MNKYARRPEQIVDLHGLTVAEATTALSNLIALKKYQHIRVITGKGTFRPTGPILRTFAKNFLAQKGARVEIAKLADGGEGALEVYFD